MDNTSYATHRLVKNEDLNHHGTLYAGRSAEWFVEAGFIAAAGVARPENIVCLKIHGMTFRRPVGPGEVILLESRILLAGRTSLHAHVRMMSKGGVVMDGFITFVNVDHVGRPVPHGVEVVPEESEPLQRLRTLLNG